jgi:hypothetical protein
VVNGPARISRDCAFFYFRGGMAVEISAAIG